MRALRKVARAGASVGRRAKSAAKRIARMTKTAALRVARAVKAAALRVSAPIVRAAKAIGRTPAMQAIGNAARTAWAQVSKTWRTTLRPFLQTWGILFGTAAWLIALPLAPVATTVITGAAGLVVLALSKGIGWLENSKSRLAKITRDVLEAIAQAVRVALYVGAGTLVTLVAATSLPFALIFALELALRSTGDWPFASIPEMLEKALDQTTPAMAGAFPIPAVSRIRVRTAHARPTRVAPPVVIEPTIRPTAKPAAVKDVTPADAPDQPELWTRGNFLRAKGTEELWGTALDVDMTSFLVHDDADEGRPIAVTTPCEGCGTTAPGLRTMDGGFCTSCYETQCEEDALKYTGVSLKARHVRVPLLPAGIEVSPEYIMSKTNPEELRWLVTARWRTRANAMHDREWSLLDHGDIVGVVTYDRHTRKYTAEALGVSLKSDISHEAAAKSLVQDIVIDARNSVGRALEGEEVPVVLAKVFEGAFSGKKG